MTRVHKAQTKSTPANSGWVSDITPKMPLLHLPFGKSAAMAIFWRDFVPFTSKTLECEAVKRVENGVRWLKEQIGHWLLAASATNASVPPRAITRLRACLRLDRAGWLPLWQRIFTTFELVACGVLTHAFASQFSIVYQ
jgi:hypothetical protein